MRSEKSTIRIDMDRQKNTVALSVLAGAGIIAVALYAGLTNRQTASSVPLSVPSQTNEAPQPSDVSNAVESTTAVATISPSPVEITWTKSDIVAALSAKTGIPQAEIVFSTGETVDNGNTKLIRGTVQRQGDMGGAGFFAVADADGVTVTYAGQGVPECSEVNPYGYPLSWADYCMDAGNTVRR